MEQLWDKDRTERKNEMQLGNLVAPNISTLVWIGCIYTYTHFSKAGKQQEMMTIAAIS